MEYHLVKRLPSTANKTSFYRVQDKSKLRCPKIQNSGAFFFFTN